MMTKVYWPTPLTALATILAMGAMFGGTEARSQTVPVGTAPVVAAPPPAESSRLEEIVITSQKRSQNLQTVGISVTAFSGEKIAQLGFTNATDLVKQTPGLNILSSSASNTNVNIRGVSQNDFADHLEGPIAVYADEGYLGASGAINGQIYDLDRVEVLRGPQGTLFGRNATGGLIHYISKEPTRFFDGYARVEAGQYGLAEFEGAVSGPLSDTVRARLSIAGTHDDGFIKNTIGPNPANHNNYSGRLQVAIDLTPQTLLKLTLNGNTNSGERGLATSAEAAVADAHGLGRAVGPNETVYGCAGCNLLGYKYPSDVFARAYDSPGTFTKNIVHGQAKLTSIIGGVTFTSITDTLYLKKDFPKEDVDGSPAALFVFNTYERYNQYSQEFRLNGDIGKLKWIAGSYLLAMRGHYSAVVDFGAPLLGAAPIVIESGNHYTLNTDSASVFAQGEYKFNDAFSAILGTRLTHDRKEMNYASFDNVGVPPAIYNKTTDPDAARSFDNVSIKAELDWHPADHTLVYTSFSRGAKGGNWAVPAFPPPITSALFPAFAHKQEILNDYEVGLKTEFWDRRARLNISSYYYDYHNYQAFSLANLLQTILNKNANAYGAEAEFILAPFEGLQISLGASAMDSKVYNLQYPNGGSYTGQLPFSAPFSSNGLVRYEWGALKGKLAIQGSFTNVGGHYFTVANEPVNYQKAYTTADARLGYTSGNGHWGGSIWVKNLTDTKFRTFGVDISALGFSGQNYAPPRWVGATVDYRF